MVKLDNDAITKGVALITGATSGIGLGMARSFAAKGYDLAINGFGDSIEIDRICRKLETDHKVKVLYSSADMTKVSEIETFVLDTITTFGRLDVVVNNAGVQYVSPVDEFPTDKWDLVISVNLTAAFHTTRLSLPQMRKQGRGRIINVASAHGLIASPNKSAYVAAKHGLVGLTKTVALETAEFGVTCNAICPGWVKTPLVETQIETLAREHGVTQDVATKEMILQRQPTREFVQVDQIAALALFLSSDDASSITGSAYSIDGGWTAH